VNTNSSVPVVGIVGGVGAGKSSIVRHLTTLRLFIIDADRIGHDVLLRSDVRDEVAAAYGPGVLNSAGAIDRQKVARLVFGSSAEHGHRRQTLNRIVHPRIHAEILTQLEQAPEHTDVIILDAALLLEASWASSCDAVIFIDTPVELRRQRVLENRGWSADEHARREATQMGLSQKRAAARFVVDNSGTPEIAATQMEQALRHLIQEKSRRR
jgi:dephospho-CoA kinase